MEEILKKIEHGEEFNNIFFPEKSLIVEITEGKIPSNEVIEKVFNNFLIGGKKIYLSRDAINKKIIDFSNPKLAINFATATHSFKRIILYFGTNSDDEKLFFVVERD